MTPICCEKRMSRGHRNWHCFSCGAELHAPLVKTECVYPPIPIRAHDWAAYDDSTIDGAPDAGFQCVGHGPTEQEAVVDFWETWATHNDVEVV
jgi:hypothetical protein